MSSSRRIRLLSELAEKLLAAEAPVDAASAAYEMIAGELDLHAYFNYLCEDGATLRLDSYTGIPRQTAKLISRLKVGDVVCGAVARTKEAIHTTHIQSSGDPRVELVRRYGHRAYFCTPLLVGGRLLGILSFGTKSRDAFSEEDLDFIGTVARYVALSDDRLRTGRELRDSEARFHAFMNNTPVLAWMKDEEGRHVYVNGTYERRLGRTLEEVRGKTDFEIWPKEVAEQFRENDEAVLAGWKPMEVVEQAPGPEWGETFWIEIKFPFEDAAGERFVGGIGLDITERLRAQEALKASERESRAFFENAAVGTTEMDADGRLLRMNEIFCRLSGYRCEELEGKTPHEITHPEDREAEIGGFEKLRRGEIPVLEMEKRLMHKDGSAIWVQETTSGIRSEGKLERLVAIVQEIGRRKETEAEREMIMHTISHDLRTPLTVIDGHSQLLQIMDLKEEARLHVEAIHHSAERMNAMIEDMVEAARLEGGPLELKKERLRLDYFIADLLRRSSTAIDPRRIRLKAPHRLPWVQADPTRLERILTNLLTNALKYSPPESKVEIECRENDGEVLCRIKDHGQGIAAEDLPHIFDRFYRTKKGRRTGGVGLGLYIARELVQAHGGQMCVKSTPGKGSEFYFTLPASERP